ncbi:MAG: UPF0104 family protein [Actinobacteria bacterium]|nr:UPF0104 family protein [Actinomycetota bacterium]
MKRILRVGASIVLVVGIFFFALPKIADFSEVWTEIGAMTLIELAFMLAATFWNIFTYWLVMMSSLPGSNIWQTMKVNQASTAVANTLPGGGAIGVGVTYGMYGSYGFTRSQISLAVLVSGIWNNFVKLGMPVVALIFVALESNVGGGFVIAAMLGLIVLLAAIGSFGAVLSSDRLAAAVGRRLEKIISSLRKPFREEPVTEVAAKTVAFRHDAISLVRERWFPLTSFTIISHVSLYFVLLIALRNVGVPGRAVSWPEVLAAFAFVRLISALPITPGGLGVVELGLSAALVTAGGDRVPVVAAVLVYRALTYLLPIPIGLALYLTYRKGSEARRERQAVL